MGRPRARVRPLQLAVLGAISLLLLIPPVSATAPAHPAGPSHSAVGVAAPPSTALNCSTRPSLTLSATPSSGVAPLRVLLSANVTGGCAPYQYQWQFGDEGEAEGPAVYHVFRSVGVFTIFGTVQDAAGASASNRTTVRVTGGSGGLAVNVSVVPAAGPAPLAVAAWANVTGGNITQVGTVRWNFGDGGFGNGTPITHTFASNGSYVVKATVTANSVVVNGSVTVQVSPGKSGGPETNLSLLVLPASAHPPANVSVFAFTNGAGAPLNLSVCFGDTTPCVTGPSSWNGTPPAMFLHRYNSTGIFSVEGTLTDPAGSIIESASALVNITAGPPLSVTANESATSGPAPLIVTFLSNISGGTPPYSIQWSFGDGSVGSSAPGGTVLHTYYAAGTFDPWLLVQDSAGNRRNITLAAIHIAASTSLTGIPGSVAGVPSSEWVLTLAAATVVGGVAIALPSGWRRRKREREKEGEELVRELEERR